LSRVSVLCKLMRHSAPLFPCGPVPALSRPPSLPLSLSLSLSLSLFLFCPPLSLRGWRHGYQDSLGTDNMAQTMASSPPRTGGHCLGHIVCPQRVLITVSPSTERERGAKKKEKGKERTTDRKIPEENAKAPPPPPPPPPYFLPSLSTLPPSPLSNSLPPQPPTPVRSADPL